MRRVFDVIPALDIEGGRLALLGPEEPRPTDAFDGDPLVAAAAAVEAGARWLHVVDLDLATEGQTRNLDVVTAIAELRIPVQAAGGVRAADDVDALIRAGATRVVLGSAALGDPGLVRSLLSTDPARLVVGIEVDAGRIRSRGRDPVDLGLMETVGWVVAAGAHALLVTSVARVGRLGGPDVDLTRRVARAGRPVLAAGGVRTVEDLRALRAAGAAGAIVGRAALDGSLDLAAAIGSLT